jgi:hypothetical protein
MTAQIPTLIDKLDTVEIVRNIIATILLEESAQQQELAAQAAQDSNLWKLRVFTERTNPWAEWIAAPDQESIDATPIVAVNFVRETFDKSKSDLFSRQQADAQFHLDVFGYGISTATETGHTPGDEKASLEAHRAVRLVRNILMSPYYVELGYPSLVGERFVESAERFPPEDSEQFFPNVVGIRITLGVNLVETVGQITGEDCESFFITIERQETGETYLTITGDLTD